MSSLEAATVTRRSGNRPGRSIGLRNGRPASTHQDFFLKPRSRMPWEGWISFAIPVHLVQKKSPGVRPGGTMSFVRVSKLSLFFSLTFTAVQSPAAAEVVHCDRSTFLAVDGLSKYVTLPMKDPSAADAIRISSDVMRFASTENGSRPCSQSSRSCQGSIDRTRFDIYRTFDVNGRFLGVQTRAQTITSRFKTRGGLGAEVYETYLCSTAPGLPLTCSRTCSIATDSSWGT